MSSQWKNCPRCSAMLAPQAVACPTCGLDLTQPYAPAPPVIAPPIETAKRPLLPWWAWLLIASPLAVILLFVLTLARPATDTRNGFSERMEHIKYVTKLHPGMSKADCEAILAGQDIDYKSQPCSDHSDGCTRAMAMTHLADQKRTVTLDFDKAGILTEASENWSSYDRSVGGILVEIGPNGGSYWWKDTIVYNPDGTKMGGQASAE